MRSNFSFIRRPAAREDKPLTYEQRLRMDLKLAEWELDCAYAGFDYATDPDLIDCYIYKLNAAMKRYKFLIECYNSLYPKSPLPDRLSASQNTDSFQITAQNEKTNAAYEGSSNVILQGW